MTEVKRAKKAAPGLLQAERIRVLEMDLAKLTGLLEHLLYDVKGERGEMLRRKFYGDSK